MRARRHQLHELGRKYGSTLAEVMAYGAEAATRLGELEGYEARAAALDAERREHETAAATAASALSAARRAAAEPLARAVEMHLRELAMPARGDGSASSSRAEPTDGGHDRVTYLLAPNPGETARPLARAASGGELSRAMLAARVVLVRGSADPGVRRGRRRDRRARPGVAVGRLLETLGSRHQVLCVTHLAQVAAFAGTQVVVEKAVGEGVEAGRSGRTVAHAAVVDGDARRVGAVADARGGR